MSVDTATLQIKVVANGIELTQRQLRELTKESGNAEKATGSLTSAYKALQGALAAAGAAMLFREITQAADAYQNLQSRLELATGSASAAHQAYGQLVSMVRESHTDLLASGELYAKLAQSTQQLGLSQQQLLTITDTVSKGFRVSGATAQETESALRQLGQAFASGTLRGDEFNSMMENAPRIAQALADSLGVTRGQLRQMAADGKLTSESMAAALLSQSGKIDAEFKKLPETVSTSMQDIKNELQIVFGETATGPLVDSLHDMRDVLADPQTAEGLRNLAGGFVTLTSWLVQAAAGFADFGKQLGYAAAKVTGNLDAMDELDHKIESLKLSMAGDKFHAGSGHWWLMSKEEMAVALKELEDQRKQLSMARFGNDGTTPTGKPNDEPAASGGPAVKSAAEIEADAKAADLEKKRIEDLQKLIDKLHEEGDTAGMTARQIDIYNAMQLKAGPAEIAAINRAHDAIDAADAKEKAIKDLAEETKKYQELQREQAQVEEEEQIARENALDGLIESLRTEEEAIAESYKRRKEIILMNTEPGSAQQNDLLGRLNKDFASQAMGDMAPQGGIDEQLAKLDEEYARKRELMLSNEDMTQAQLLELERGYEEKKNLMRLQYQSMQLGNAAAGFGAMSDLAKQFGGEQSKAFQGLFAVSKGFALAKAMIDMQAGISAGIALGWPMSIPAVAAAAAQGAAAIANIKGQNFSGAYDAGGTIPAGSFGLVGEVGPELVSGPATVTSRKDTAEMLGQKSQVKVAVFNLLDKKELLESLKGSDDFDEVVINSLSRNQTAAKSAMGQGQ